MTQRYPVCIQKDIVAFSWINLFGMIDLEITINASNQFESKFQEYHTVII